MKKVRFESPNKLYIFKMNDSECHSPRPFIERELRSSPPVLVSDYSRVLTYSNDPIQRYECSNSSPYPVVNRTQLPGLSEKEPCWKPSDDLNLSLLDGSNHVPCQSAFHKSILKDSLHNKFHNGQEAPKCSERQQTLPLSSVENNKTNEPTNVLLKDNSFFIKRDNLEKYHFNMNPIETQLNRLSLGKENAPLVKKAEFVKNVAGTPLNNPLIFNSPMTVSPTISDECRCHHCIRTLDCVENQVIKVHSQNFKQNCICSTPKNQVCSQCHHITMMSPPHLQQNVWNSCNCHSSEPSSKVPQNAVDRKTWAIEKYEQSKQPNCTQVDKQKNVSKEKREPTVADLFKIIKLQNEQLQLLQEKVDKFMLSRQNVQPTITCSTEHVALNSVDNNQNKMSVGVMTSFEVIRTSTVINKEVVTQSNDAQMQCNRSQISIKEVASNPVNINFLEGIIHKNTEQTKVQNIQNNGSNGNQIENVCEEKTLNELSLYNVQVDNATTPLMSPEQTLYLDVRDYSDSEASSNDRSNVGWTYYNKVMTHVNGMLQDSEMPSSASAMYRNMRQQRVQMHIDTTNVSVTKRVKFGDDPLGLHQPHIYAPATDTSLKMNQLAAKYLKQMPVQVTPRSAALVAAPPVEMSIATRNYMEKHRLLQGFPAPSRSPQAGDIPRFLDITALKQQPKFL